MTHDILFKHLQQKVRLSLSEKEIIKTFFISRTLKKRKLLLQEGYVCQYLSFVANGLLKTYNIDGNGKEHINQFTPEGWWTSDMHSFFHGVPSVYTIDALEDSELLMITAGDFEKLTLQVPIMDRYFRILFQNSLIVKERRLVQAHTLTAEEKYRELVANNPGLVNRVPQNLLASYLGLTAATVSRLKKNLIFGQNS